MRSFKNVIDAIGGARVLANETGEKLLTARGWRQRNSIPANKWPLVTAAARRRGVGGVTYELLATLAERRRESRG